MTSFGPRLAQARPATFVVHACKTLAATLVAFAATALPLPNHPSVQEHALLQWLVGLGLAPTVDAVRTYTFTLSVWLLVTPFLSTFWLSALHIQAPLAQHVRAAAARYLKALVLSLISLAYLSSLLWLAIALSFGVQRLLAFTHDERTQDLCALAVSLPAALFTFHALALHDLSLAQLTRGAPSVRAALSSAWRAARLACVVRRAGYAACICLLGLLGILLPRWAFVSGTYADSAVLVLGQCVALAITLVRARWLAYASSRLA